MFITTAGRTNEEMIKKAKAIANSLKVPYKDRNKQSIKVLLNHENDGCMVVGKNRLELFHHLSKEPFFFHPNSASFRLKRVMNGDEDPFLQVAELQKGMSFLDCTLGLGSDSILASFAVGETGKIVGLEENPFVAYIVREGLRKWQTEVVEMKTAMNNIEVVNTHSLHFLKELPSNSFDCVYFDPMFHQSIVESNGINSLRTWASPHQIDSVLIREAKRVAKHRIILKDHFRTPNFEEYGFKVINRPTSKFHFGVIELK
ncbi:class I SAM-dependent methyltransferase [Rossellomorea sp. BNER]|uniref:class I SAM-dependent methyltransferase n=1 Tax=Rossellomorea sp. BNER TaxID=2962031 RepID=UPI003AF22348|nr:class I SAM-dependent methyltransferase [Rossellomorea sp. BNER]